MTLSFIAACVVCVVVIVVFAIVFPSPSSAALWYVAGLVAFLVAGYQRRTGPGYEIPASRSVAGTRVSTRLPTSFPEQSDCPVKLRPVLTGATPMLVYRRYPTEDPWSRVAFVASEDGMVAHIPQQPPAGKVEYHIELACPEDRCTLPRRDNVTVRYRGSVSPVALVPHVLLIMTGMVYSLRTGLETLYEGPSESLYMSITVITMVGGAMVFGPLVQKQAFGKYWTGFPLGTDLTDTKMLVAVVAWLAALAASSVGWAPAAALRVAASGLTLLAFLIPHSLFGSELRYDEQS